MQIEFEDAIRRDDSDQAYHCVMAMIGVARTLEDEPVLVAQFVQIAIASMALAHLKTAVELDLFDDQQLTELLVQLRSFDNFGRKYRLAIAGERAYGQPYFDDVSRWEDTGLEIPFGPQQRPIDALAMLDVMARLESVPTDDLSRFLSEANLIAAEMDAEYANANWLQRYDTVLTEDSRATISSSATAIARSAMEMRFAKMGIGLRLFRKHHGRWPQSIAELTTDAAVGDMGPVVPVGGAPFGFRNIDGNVELWGFAIEQCDVTPGEPFDPSQTPDESDDHLGYWYWDMKPIPARTTEL